MNKLDKSLALDNQLCFALNAAARAIVKVYMETLRKHDLTYSQYLVFIALMENGELSVSELGKHLHLDSGTLTPLLKRMETDGHVTRRRPDHDERQVLVALTEKGEQLNDVAKEARALVVKRLNMDDERILTLRDELMDITNNLMQAD